MTAMAHHYKQARQHQHNVWANGGGSVTTDPTGRTEHSYGSAPYGEHALAAWWSAKRAVHFRETFDADMKASAKRTRAAKKAWKTRKANA